MTIRIANVITRMIVGGPQQVSLAVAGYYRDQPGFEFHLLSGLEAGAEGEYLSEIEAQGIRFHPVNGLVRAAAPLRDLGALVDLRRKLRQLSPHIVHARSAKARLLAPLAARLTGVPVILQTVHGWSFNNQVDWRRSLFVQLEKVACTSCHCNVFVSERDLAEGIELGIIPADALERGKAAIIRSGIDLTSIARSTDEERRALRRSLGVSDGEEVVSLVQRLSHPKTPEVFLEAMRPLVEKRPQVQVWVVGDGMLRPACERTVERWGIKERVHFLGLRKDVPAILSASDVVVHSSIREGLPRVVLESMAIGTPLVATDVGGVREAVRPGENALLVPPSNPEALTRSVLSVLDEPESTRRRVEEGKRSARDFSATRMLDDQHALYLRLLSARGIVAAQNTSSEEA
jgi:glycosyltransferase involved in cell wall biosynthesis